MHDADCSSQPRRKSRSFLSNLRKHLSSSSDLLGRIYKASSMATIYATTIITMGIRIAWESLVKFSRVVEIFLVWSGIRLLLSEISSVNKYLSVSNIDRPYRFQNSLNDLTSKYFSTRVIHSYLIERFRFFEIIHFL